MTVCARVSHVFVRLPQVSFYRFCLVCVPAGRLPCAPGRVLLKFEPVLGRGWPLWPRGAVGAGPAAVRSRPRFRLSRGSRVVVRVCRWVWMEDGCEVHLCHPCAAAAKTSAGTAMLKMPRGSMVPEIPAREAM